MNIFAQTQSIPRLVLIILAAMVIGACAPTTSTNPAPAVESPAAQSVPAADTAPTSTPEGESAPVVEFSKINLNQMTEADLLATIPDFNSRMVREFFEYQPYVSIQQFRREIGKYVDDTQVAAYEQYVYVPVDVNESDAETLKQVPGVDNVVAEALMTGRPYASNEAFLTALAELVPGADMTTAAAYLAE